MSKRQIENFPLTALSQIAWKQADIFEPSTYEAELEKADAVVHSLGAIHSDSRYKDMINGDLCSAVPILAQAAKEAALSRSPISILRSNSFSSDANPMKKSPQESQGENEKDIIYKLNKESAVILAQAFAQVKNKPESLEVEASLNTHKQYPFVYISADDHNKFAPEAYIESKREAEALLSQIDGLRSVFLRPGMMNDYTGKGNTIRDHLVKASILRNTLSSVLGMEKIIGSSPVLSVQTVAKAVVEALDDPTLSGPISLAALHKYATESS